jgi:hypothetical protein
LGSHIKKIYKEIIGKSSRAAGKYTMFRTVKLVSKARIPPTNTVSSGAVRVNNCALSINKDSVETVNFFSDNYGIRQQQVQDIP